MAFAMYSPIFCVPPMEHILKEELLLTHAQTSLLFTAPILAMVAVAIPAGLVADRIGARKAAGIGAIILASGAILRGMATDASSLLAFTFIYGVGFGWVFPNLPKLVSAWVPREKAGMAIGIISTGIPVGIAVPLAVTMSLIFPITNNFQGVFFIWSIPPILAAILWWILVKEPPQDRISDKMLSRAKIPLRQVLRNKAVWLVAILFLLHAFFTYAWYGWTPALLMLKRATPELAGLLTSVTAWVSIPAFFLMPRLSYKMGVRRLFLWVPAILLALVAWLAIYIDLSMIWLLMVVVGVADAAKFTTLMALPVEMMPKEEVGRASGLILSIGFIGAIIGPLIGGHILDLTGSLDILLLILMAISIPAIAMPFRIREK